MMRKLTATRLTAVAVAGLAGTGAALAASSYGAKPVTTAVSVDKPSKNARVHESSERTSRERATKDRSDDTRSTERAADAVGSSR